MAYTNFIQPTLPPDTGESPSLGASRIRNLKAALIERLTSWIYGFDSAGTENDIGVKKIPCLNQSPAPVTPSEGVVLYASNDEAYIKDKEGNAVQVTRDGVIANVGTTYETKNINTEYLADTPLFLYLDSNANNTVTVAADINFDTILINREVNFSPSVPFFLIIPKGVYYRITSATSGTYKVLQI